jgi:uncharacterized protein (DUF1330 family)
MLASALCDVSRRPLRWRDDDQTEPTMATAHLSPTPEQMAAILALDVEGPVVMVNLLRFKPQGGAETYARYGEQAAPFLQRFGAKIRFAGLGRATVIGGESWDEVVLVEYPSKQAFLDMVRAPGYPSDVRASALLDSRLYCTTEGLS